ncbi:MAG: hypothetical protein WBG48_00850 [Pricia sp.]
MDKKESNENTEFVKEEHQDKRGYIFQKSTITKVATLVIIIFLVIIILGLVVSGTTFFDSGL